MEVVEDGGSCWSLVQGLKGLKGQTEALCS